MDTDARMPPRRERHVSLSGRMAFRQPTIRIKLLCSFSPVGAPMHTPDRDENIHPTRDV
jgi:hypothetical protein